MNYEAWSSKAIRAIRAILAERNESIESLSENTGIALSTLKRRLKGTTPFTVDEIGMIADYFTLPFTAVLTPITERPLANRYAA
jgi:transcriptional regulator with XRE-family HTH domain